MNARFKHPLERGLREKKGKWEYRFTFRGKPYSQVTGFEAVQENVLKAQILRTAHLEQLRAGKIVVKHKSAPLSHAIPHFVRWYRSEHPKGGKCAWAQALLASFEFYFEQLEIPLCEIGPAKLEAFKIWRRDNGIHDNTLHKQLLLMRKFFQYARKHGWIDGDPFARGQDTEVRIPAERESEAMHVLSPEEQTEYLAAAKQESMDLFDVATILVEQGPRPDEVMSLTQRNIDLVNRHFTIWENSTEGKSRSAHRRLRMTDTVYEIFRRRMAVASQWVFPSSKNAGPRTTLQKSHTRVVFGKRDLAGNKIGGCNFKCRLYDMRHTFATRFALAGGSLPILSKILGHTDMAMLNKYVHPSQQDMDGAMEWFAKRQSSDSLNLEQMLIEFSGPFLGGWPGPTLGPTTPPDYGQIAPSRTNSKRRTA